MSMEMFWGYKAEVKERTERRERLGLQSKVEGEEHLEIYGTLKEEVGMQFSRPSGPRKSAENSISCGTWTCQK